MAKSKKHVKKLGRLVLTLVLVAILSLAPSLSMVKVSAFRAMLQPRVLANYERVEMDLDRPTETVLAELEDGSQLLNAKSRSMLDAFDIPYDGEIAAKVVKNNAIFETYYSLNVGDAEIEVDQEGNLHTAYSGKVLSEPDDPSKVYHEGVVKEPETYLIDTREKVQPILEMIEEQAGLEEYTLYQCDNQAIPGVWQLTWYMYLENGAMNPYDNVVVIVNAKDGSIYRYGHTVVTPDETQAILDREDAVSIARTVDATNLSAVPTTAELRVVRPNFYWEGAAYESADFVRLAWNVTFDGSVIVQVDARTGEILGGDVTQGLCTTLRVGCAVPELFGSESSVSNAQSGLQKLGYTIDGGNGPFNWEIEKSDVEWMFNVQDIGALYFRCHGSTTVLSDKQKNGNWTFKTSEVASDRPFRFVFLDGCSTSKNNNWAIALNIVKKEHFYSKVEVLEGKCFIGWNLEVYDTTQWRFGEAFFGRLSQDNFALKITIHQCVVDSLVKVRGEGYSNCDPGFIGDPNWLGFAW